MELYCVVQKGGGGHLLTYELQCLNLNEFVTMTPTTTKINKLNGKLIKSVLRIIISMACQFTEVLWIL